MAGNVQAALEGISVIGTGNVTVSYDAQNSSSTSQNYQIQFRGDRADQNIADFIADSTNLSLAMAKPYNVTQGRAPQAELQRVTIDTEAAQGTLRLSLEHGGQTHTTAAISFDATQAEVQDAINTGFVEITAAAVEVTFWNGRELAVSFGGSLVGEDVSLLAATATAAVEAAQLALEQAGYTDTQEGLAAQTIVVDYAASPLDVVAGTGGTTVTLDMAGSDGERIWAAGNMTLGVGGIADLAGHFQFDRPGDTENTKILIGGEEISAFLGVNDTGLALQNGRLGMVLMPSEDGSIGYAAQGSGVVSTQGVAITFTGDVDIRANQTGLPVDEIVSMDSGDIHVQFEDGVRMTQVTPSDLDVSLVGTFGELMDDLGASLTDLTADLSVDVDDDGNRVANSILVERLPGLGVTLDDLLGVSAVLNVGTYVQHYLHPALRPGEPLEEDDTIPLGDYGGGDPTLRGLADYLQEYWVVTLPGDVTEGLVIDFTDEGVQLNFAADPSFSREVQLDFGDSLDAIGMQFDSETTFDVGVAADIDFGLAIDWINSDFSFNLNQLGLQVTTNVDDLFLGATVGPLEVSVGQQDGQRGSATVDFGGAISLVNGEFNFIPANNTLSAELPVFASLAGVNLAQDATPTVSVTGAMFGNDSGFSLTTSDFDKLGDFSDLTVAQIIQMFPDFRDYLEDEVQNSESMLSQIPFVDGTLSQVLAFADAFDDAVYSKIDFDRPRVDLLMGTGGSIEAGQTTFTAVGAGFTEDVARQYISFLDGDVVVGTYRIDQVVDADILELASGPDESVSDQAFVVHERTEKLKTLQELTQAVNASGVLPAGIQISFDPATQTFTIPLSFSANPADIETPLDFGFDLGDALSISTNATGMIRTTITGGVDLFVDLDGAVFTGTDGVLTAGSKQFTSLEVTFTDAMIGYELSIGDALYEIAAVTGEHSVTLNQTATETLSGQSFSVEQGLVLGIAQANLVGDVSLDVADPEVAATIGFMGVTAGGEGTGSGIHVGATAAITLDRDPTSAKPDETRFSFPQIYAGDVADAVQLDFSGDAYARLKGLSLDAGLGSDLPVAPNAEIALYMQDLLDFASVQIVNQNPALPFDLDAQVASGALTGSELVVVLPDLGAGFDFSNVSFVDIVRGVRMGLDFLNESLEDEPFYEETLPIINRSLSDVFHFVDDVAAKVEDAADNPAGAIQEVESVFEQALGITDNNSLDPQDQKFSLTLNGQVLDLHVNYEAVFSDLYCFSLDLGTLLPGEDTIGQLSDMLGGSGNIVLEAIVDLSVDVGIRFVGESSPEIFLYDYHAGRDVEAPAAADAFSTADFADGSSVVTEDMYQAIKDEFQAMVATAAASHTGGTVVSVQATVVSAIDSSVGADANTDDVHGAGQLLGRRQLALLDLADRLTTELGTEVTLFVGEQIEAAGAAALALVPSFQHAVCIVDVPVSADQATGTHLTLGARILGSDLDLGFQAGAIQIGVSGGSAVLDADGNVGTSDYASLTVALDQASGTENDDEQFHFDTESLADNIQLVLAGGFDVNLPIRLDVAGFQHTLDTPIRIQTNPVYGDQGLRELIKRLIDAPDQGEQPAVVYTHPDIVGEFESLGGSFSIMSLINDPSIVIDGVDIALGSLEDVFGDSVAEDVPLIGDKLLAASSFLGDLRTGLLSDLREKVSGNGKLIEVVRQSLFDIFGPSGLDILNDNTSNGSVTVDDILVGWYDQKGAFIESWVAGGDLPEIEPDAIQFDIGLGGVLYGDGVDIPLDIDLPGFGLEVDGGFAMELSWSYDFGFGLSVTDAFYLTTNSDSDDPEFEFNVDVFLDGTPDDPGVTTAFVGTGKLLFFKATLVDQDRDPNTSGFQPGGVNGALTLDYTGNDAGRFTLTHMMSQPLSSLFNVDFGVDAGMRLGTTLELDGASGLPKLKGDLVLDWDWSLDNGASDPSISLERFRVDVGSFVSDFLKPIAEKVQAVLEPFRPIVDGLTQEISGLDILLAEPNMMGLINLILQVQGKRPIDWSFVYAAKDMLALVDQVNAMLGSDGEIYLGTLSGLGTSSAVASQATEADLAALPPEQRVGLSLDGPPAVSSGLNDISSSSSGGGSSTQRSGFKTFEYIKDIGNWLNILQGGDATLFTYEMPLLEFGAEFNVPLVVVPLGPAVLSVNAMGAMFAAVDLAFGYDTYGIRKAIDTGNPLYALDGFYVSDFTLPQFSGGSIVPGTGGEEKPEFTFTMYAGLEAAVSLVVVRGGLRGGSAVSSQCRHARHCPVRPHQGRERQRH